MVMTIGPIPSHPIPTQATEPKPTQSRYQNLMAMTDKLMGGPAPQQVKTADYMDDERLTQKRRYFLCLND